MRTALTVRVLLHECNLLAHKSAAVSYVSATRFGVERLPAIASEPLSKRPKGIVDVIGDAIGVCARVIAVEILVHVKDEIGGATIGVGDFVESIS